jgi:hypothetical protein
LMSGLSPTRRVQTLNSPFGVWIGIMRTPWLWERVTWTVPSLDQRMEPTEGIEPTTGGLQNRCSTVELRRRGAILRGLCRMIATGDHPEPMTLGYRCQR